MNGEMAARLMLESALPIDDVDQITMLPGRTLILVWVDVQDRPDLADLAALQGGGPSTFLMTWFAAAPGKRNMIIGLRVEMEATSVVFHLAFKVERYLPELEILVESGLLWVVPGPPNPVLPGIGVRNAREMQAIGEKGVQFELGPDMQAVLRNQLTVWKQRHRQRGEI
jgi:hypothetical protein